MCGIFNPNKTAYKKSGNDGKSMVEFYHANIEPSNDGNRTSSLRSGCLRVSSNHPFANGTRRVIRTRRLVLCNQCPNNCSRRNPGKNRVTKSIKLSRTKCECNGATVNPNRKCLTRLSRNQCPQNS